MVLVDGYTRYIAAKKLGLSEVYVLEVKELAEEGVK
ncbi:ParB N-terminal domain-containing protein [Priestia filamentosa]